MIWIIGGTSETRELLKKFSDENIEDYIVTVVSEEGLLQIPEYRNKAVIRKMNFEEMKKFIDEEKISTAVDMSHPFAKEVSRNAKKAAEEREISYIRFIRDEADVSNCRNFENIETLKEYLSEIEGTVFFTTGSKDIGEFESVRGNNRFVYRILPAQYGIDICRENNIALKDIVAVLGPFSKDFNKAFFENYKADYAVMKNSGNSGGTQEKIDACLELGIEPLVLKRDREEGTGSIDEILEMIL